MKKIILLLMLSILLSGYTDKEFRLTGYYPYTAKKHEKHVEGGTNDCAGNKLFWLHSNKDYVSVAVDKRIIPLNSYLVIDCFPDKVFKAVDVGSKIKGNKIDICVWDKQTAINLPKKARITIIDKKYVGMKLDTALSFLKR